MSRKRFQIVATATILLLAAFASANAHLSAPAIASPSVTASTASSPSPHLTPLPLTPAAPPGPHQAFPKTLYLPFDPGPTPRRTPTSRMRRVVNTIVDDTW
jgi:hypothetical protein